MANCISIRIQACNGIGANLARGCKIRFALLLVLVSFAGLVHASGSKPPKLVTSKGAPVGLKPMFPGIEFQQPLGMLQAPGDDDNWFVLEKKGRIVRVYLAKGLAQPQWRSEQVLDISHQVDSSSEGGLLGAAFHPGFAKNRQLFVSYTGDGSESGAEMQSVLSQFYLNKDLQVVVNKKEKILLLTEQPYGNHNGGQIAFSAKGYLYYGLGDGGAAGDPHENGQNVKSLLGSMLRLDVNKKPTYGIPADNPLQNSRAAGSGARAEIYAWGLRNPWRWSFDRLNGELWLADVGQNAWEEINKVVPGGNYGWNEMEGLHCYASSSCKKAKYRPPVLEYGHENGRCSITGGYVYRGQQIKALYGSYIYGDFCSGEIWSFATDSVVEGAAAPKAALLLNTDMNISSFAEDNSGEIYVIDLTGHIFKFIKP